MTDRPKSILKQAAIQIGAGGSAGFVEVCIMHPLDLVKTRLQIQTRVPVIVPGVSGEVYYDGIFDCVRKMYKKEGLLSLWKGIIPPILAETPKRAVKFFTFEQYKKIFLFGAASPTPVTFALAGACAGITEAVFVNPFEVVKVSLQANRSTVKEVPSTWTVTKEIVRNHGFGLQGLNKGLSATVARNGVFNMIYFGFYHSVNKYLPKVDSNYGEFAKKISVGFTSGVLASCLNIPFDVAKSRIQGPQPVHGEIKYRTTIGSMRVIYIEEGWRALYKGLAPKVMRLGPGGAIMLVVYEYAHDYLTAKFPD